MDIESVYTQYFKDVFLYVRSLSADAGTAEEIAQETFMRALKSLDSFDGSRDIRAWLFTIAKNTYYTFCRREHIYADPELAEGYTESRLPESKSQRFAEARVIKKIKEQDLSEKSGHFSGDRGSGAGGRDRSVCSSGASGECDPL